MGFASELARGRRHLAASDKRMAALVEKYGPPAFKPHKDHYGELVMSIVGQQLSVKAAAAIWRRVLALTNGQMPTPWQLQDIDTETLRSVGLSYAKAAYVHDLAEHIIDGRLDLAHITTLPNEQLIGQLTAVKGIGEWSAHMFMIFSLGRLDILPVGDLGVRKAAQNIYGLRELPTADELKKLSVKKGWPPYESVAAWYLWKSLENTGNRVK